MTHDYGQPIRLSWIAREQWEDWPQYLTLLDFLWYGVALVLWLAVMMAW